MHSSFLSCISPITFSKLIWSAGPSSPSNLLARSKKKLWCYSRKGPILLKLGFWNASCISLSGLPFPLHTEQNALNSFLAVWRVCNSSTSKASLNVDNPLSYEELGSILGLSLRCDFLLFRPNSPPLLASCVHTFNKTEGHGKHQKQIKHTKSFNPFPPVISREKG